MRLAICADIHMRAKRLKEIKNAWEQALGIMVEEEVKLLLISGDIFHFTNIYDSVTKGATTGTILSAFKDPLLKAGIKTLIIQGTHDAAEGSQAGALAALVGIPEIIILTEPEVIRLGQVTIGAIPWGYQGQGVIAELKEKLLHLDQTLKIILGHCAVREGEVSDEYRLPGEECEYGVGDLATLGADLVLLGHYHKRQTLGNYANIRYVGALLQQSFGDEGNPQGFEIIHYQPGKPIQERYIEIDAPQYYTVNRDDYYPEDYKPTDYVKIIGKKPPDNELPSRHTFVREVEKTEFCPRVKVSTNQDITELLKIWLDQSGRENTDYDRLKEKLLGLNLLDRTDVGFGSLEKINRIYINNIARHNNTEVVLPEGMITIIGPNGSGKTTFLESIIATFYGSLVTYSSSLYDYVSNSTGEGVLEIDFSANGSMYRATRVLSTKRKKPSQKGLLIELPESLIYPVQEKEYIAGPKISSFEKAVASRVGSKDTLIKTIFNSQKLTGDLMDADPADRKIFFYRLMGIDWMIKKADEAWVKAGEYSRTAGEATAAMRVAEKQIETLQDNITALQEIPMELDQVTDQMEDLINIRDKIHENLTEKLVSAKSLDEEIKRANKAEQEKIKIEEEVDRLRRLIQAEDILASEKDSLIVKAQEAKEAQVEHNHYQGTILENAKHEQNIAKAETAINRLEVEIRQVEGKYAERQIALQHNIDKAKQALEAEIANLRYIVEHSSDKIKLLDKVGCRDNPLPCVFIDDAVEAKKEIGQKRQELESKAMLLDQEIFALDERNELDKLTVDQMVDETIQSLRDQVKGFKAIIEIETGQIVAVDKGRLDYLTAQIASLPRLEEELNKAELAKQKIDEYTRLLSDKEGELAAKGNDLTTIHKALSQKLELEKDISVLTCRKSEIEEEITRVGERIKALQRSAARLAVYEEELKTVDGKINQYKKNKDLSEIEGKDYSVLAEALDKNGIPQLIIENSFPQLEAICQDFLTHVGANFSISLAALRPQKNESFKETVDILITDDLGTRDIKDHSGGEQKLARSIFRIALAYFQKQEAGKDYHCLLADELFDELDEENMSKLLDVLAYVRGQFKQIITVTHNTGLIYSRPQTFDLIIRFDLHNGKTVIR